MIQRLKVFLNNRHDVRRAIITISLCVIAWHLTKPASHQTGLTQMEKRAQRERYSHGIVSNTSHSLGFWLKEGEAEEFTPRIVWFLAWPTSGEDYVLTTMEHVSNKSLSTNYGEEVTPEGYPSIPIYPRHPEGPYWEGLGSPFGGKIRSLPLSYVWTKTHCNSRCVDCPPEEYLTDVDSFVKACRTTTAERTRKTKISDNYPVELVHKAVHFIRNPFFNLIQRFINERNLAEQRNDAEFLETYPMLPKKGFQKWCFMLDNKYKKEDEEEGLSEQVRKTMCHGELYKYLQWHNYAFEATEQLGLETMVVYYEDFYTEFNETMDALLAFTNQSRRMKPYPFSTPHNYSRFYGMDHRADFGAMAKEVASPKTWEYMEHFFDPKASFW